jgi:hypothetical protein
MLCWKLTRLHGLCPLSPLSRGSQPHSLLCAFVFCSGLPTSSKTGHVRLYRPRVKNKQIHQAPYWSFSNITDMSRGGVYAKRCTVTHVRLWISIHGNWLKSRMSGISWNVKGEFTIIKFCVILRALHRSILFHITRDYRKGSDWQVGLLNTCRS